MKSIVVIIPTFRRPDSLERAVRSVLAQDAFDALVEEVLVVDNDPAASGRRTIEALQRGCDALRYLPCPQPGVSNARNAGVAASTAPLIAFLDDDEEAPPRWLSDLHTAHASLGSDVTFGPVCGRAEQAAEWKRAYLEAFFSRTGPPETRLTDQVYGCGNSMLTRATALAANEPFDVRANETGGEDDRLFLSLKAEGRRFGWAGEAWVYEHAAGNRQTARYALTRAFAYGQSPCQIAARDRSYLSIPGWMAIGAAQALVFSLAAALTLPFASTRALRLADLAARGLGKLFWFKTLYFYGAPTRVAASSRSRGAASRIPVAARITQSRSL